MNPNKERRFQQIASNHNKSLHKRFNKLKIPDKRQIIVPKHEKTINYIDVLSSHHAPASMAREGERPEPRGKRTRLTSSQRSMSDGA